jgi:hypothetical protein
MAGTAYKIEFTSYDVKVQEFSYQKKTDKTYAGVKHVRDVIGQTYYTPSRYSIGSTVKDTLGEALVTALQHSLKNRKDWQEIEATIGEALLEAGL